MMTTERLDLTNMVDPIDVPCETKVHHATRSDEPATWVVWTIRCCTARPGIGLACDPCLRRILTTHRAATCPDCGHREPRARDQVIRFERINKPPTGTPPTGS